MKHTQGKWENDNTDKYYKGHWIRMNGVLIAKISHQKGGKSKGEPEANARLIAATPDLLEALKDLCQWVERARNILTKGKPKGSWEMLNTQKARNAIAKAEEK